MVRRPLLAAVWGLIASACALDMGGLGSSVPAEGADSSASRLEAATVDQSAGEPDEAEAQGGDASTAPAEAADAPPGADAPAVGPACDQDGDGARAMGACGGDDCCDEDAHVHPGQTSYFAEQGACGGYDYDCDGQETPEYGDASCQWSSFACSGDGFAPPVPTCGAFGTFTTCSPPWYNVFSCAESDAQQAQACR
jgi:hypothetical protein